MNQPWSIHLLTFNNVLMTFACNWYSISAWKKRKWPQRDLLSFRNNLTSFFSFFFCSLLYIYCSLLNNLTFFFFFFFCMILLFRSSLFHISCLYLCPIAKTNPELRSTEDRDYDDAEGGENATTEQQPQQTPPPSSADNKESTPPQGPASGAGKEVASPQAQRPASQKSGSASKQSPRPPSKQPQSEQGDVDDRDDATLGIFDCPVYVNKVIEDIWLSRLCE